MHYFFLLADLRGLEKKQLLNIFFAFTKKMITFALIFVKNMVEGD